MASTGVAPVQSPNRTLIGPLCTQAGFQYWYLVCFPDCKIPVPQSITAFFMFGLSGGGATPGLGLIGALIHALVSNRSQKFRQRTEAALQRSPLALLRAKPNVVYQLSQLRSITFKNLKGGGNLILPDLTVETSNGKKQKYGVLRPDFDKICAQLKQMYPGLCR